MSRTATAIERRHRPEYAEKREQLSSEMKLELDLVEEGIMSDPVGTHLRRPRSDGAIVDLSAYDESGLLVSFRLMPDGTPVFIDFILRP